VQTAEATAETITPTPSDVIDPVITPRVLAKYRWVIPANTETGFFRTVEVEAYDVDHARLVVKDDADWDKYQKLVQIFIEHEEPLVVLPEHVLSVDHYIANIENINLKADIEKYSVIQSDVERFGLQPGKIGDFVEDVNAQATSKIAKAENVNSAHTRAVVEKLHEIFGVINELALAEGVIERSPVVIPSDFSNLNILVRNADEAASIGDRCPELRGASFIVDTVVDALKSIIGDDYAVFHRNVVDWLKFNNFFNEDQTYRTLTFLSVLNELLV
jgi:hypothetical protein